TQPIYGLTSTISVKEKSNPLFSAGTTIAFNWGGVSDKVETIKRTLTSRTHNEKVVKRLKLYIEYLQEGRFRMEDMYGKTPFKVELDSNKYQIQNTLIRIKIYTDNNYRLTVDFPEDKPVTLLNYENERARDYLSPKLQYSMVYKMGDKVSLPFLNMTLNLNLDRNSDEVGNIYYIRLNNLDQVVGSYQDVGTQALDGTSLISISMMGSNKIKVVDFLNVSVEELAKAELIDKTDFARNTKDFIDKQFEITSDTLKAIEDNLGSYKKANKIYDLTVEGQIIFAETVGLERERIKIKNRLEYLDILENYINTHNTYTKIPAPAIIEIEDAKIRSNIDELTQLSIEKAYWMENVTADHPSLMKVEEKIKNARLIFLENISTLRSLIKISLAKNNNRQSEFDFKLSKLPKKQQQLVNFERKFTLTESNYTFLMQKKYEASIAIAATVSDITVLDKAKDVGQVSDIPKTGFNYALALLVGLLIPIVIVVVKELLNNKIVSVEEIERAFSIPILGVIGTHVSNNNCAVFERPKSSIAEGFRALRSNLQFMFKQDDSLVKKGKVITVTSSVSGEGKTFIAMNMATVFALSDKKTIIIGLDLRKPKLYKYFEMDNEFGAVNYLVGQKTIQEVTRKTKIPNLDIITAGPIPPNPYELLLKKSMDEFISNLKNHYDYIVIDTPPVAIVSDALELFK
ncbi:MAG: sugar transporter, partial [Flavobacteriales bacterium CG03_land_8_20_14_0_80_35_15]